MAWEGTSARLALTLSGSIASGIRKDNTRSLVVASSGGAMRAAARSARVKLDTDAAPPNCAPPFEPHINLR